MSDHIIAATGPALHDVEPTDGGAAAYDGTGPSDSRQQALAIALTSHVTHPRALHRGARRGWRAASAQPPGGCVATEARTRAGYGLRTPNSATTACAAPVSAATERTLR